MSDWQKDIAEVKTELKFLREDVNIMQKQIRDLKDAIVEIKDDMKALEEKTDKNIKRALDNPLSKMK